MLLAVEHSYGPHGLTGGGPFCEGRLDDVQHVVDVDDAVVVHVAARFRALRILNVGSVDERDPDHFEDIGDVDETVLRQVALVRAVAAVYRAPGDQSDIRGGAAISVGLVTVNVYVPAESTSGIVVVAPETICPPPLATQLKVASGGMNNH